ncbi:MAG: DUF1501 domain-containing protein [Gammaproteobacteria bacterium]|nr:DUF1501 domain-containing protein [Gammaproteobacteria bacterium]
MKIQSQSSRRRFLRQLAVLAGGSTLLSTQTQLGLVNSALAADYSNLSDHKSLVCIFLFGGNDSLNNVVPYTASEYQKYATVRQNMAIDRSQLLPINNDQQGFHPSLADVRTLYNEGKVAIVPNVGTLFEPTTRDDYIDNLEGNNFTAQLPPNLFSHSHQQETWQTNQPSEPGSAYGGWGGLLLDRFIAANTDPAIPATFSTAGQNFWPTGDMVRSFVLRGGRGIGTFEHFDDSNWPPQETSRSQAWRAILDMPRSDLLLDQYAQTLRGTRYRSELLRDALEQAPDPQTPYDSNNPLAEQLRTIAKMISIRDTLGLKRQIFFASTGGYDTHANQQGQQPGLLSRLNHAMFSFQRTLEELNLAQTVTTFTASEFGRTMTSNGDGTDHAWAADYLVMGGQVNGGQIHGDPIAYTAQAQGQHWGQPLFGPNDVGSGRFVPKYATDQYGATLAKWLGLDAADANAVFPNLNKFPLKDLGFMA